MNLSLFQKPSRYINNEINAIKKGGEVRVALAFPDIYDIGMSHLGLRILYKIINDLPYASAERVFHPWLDMEKEMKHRGILLSSLETERPLKEFDIVGFSLQYELSYTTVLNMLALGGVPHKSEDRMQGNAPLVIAGGPCTVNPLPMSKFMDAFLIGDAEEAIKEIVDTYRKWKKEGDGKRESILKALSQIEGMYVPNVHNSFLLRIPPLSPPLPRRGWGGVKRRYIESLDLSPYPEAPIVPYTPIIHDRVNIEVSRGCTMGCRFCQAGMIYRPLRERSPDNVLRIAENSLKNTGYEELSFTSLSAGDYSCLLPLIKECNRRFSAGKVSLSLPSLRVAAVNQEVLREIKSVKKTGFTIAPEAATARLRNVINKDFTEEDYERSLKALFEEGWQNLKLYFMIGLPTETDEDVEAIQNMVITALKIAKSHTKRYVNINVGVSPFVPKPHTPFQWHGQENIEKIKKKMRYLKEIFRKKRFELKEHREDMSLLEAVFARGDERLFSLIEKAWSLGCVLDAWGEAFDFKKWTLAMDETGIDAKAYAEKIYAKDDLLPWDIIDIGIKKEFLYKEYQRAVSAEITTDCRKTCHACGLKCDEVIKDVQCSRPALAEIQDSTPLNSPLVRGELSALRRIRRGEKGGQYASGIMYPGSKIRIRVEYSKTGSMRWLSHLELVTAILRALRRAKIPLIYSQGFNPLPRVSFGPALSVGVSGMREYFDIEILHAIDLESFVQSMNSTLPEGLSLNFAGVVSDREPSLSSFISRYEYEIICPDAAPAERFITQTNLDGKKGMIENAEILCKNKVRLILCDAKNKKVKINELLSEIFNVSHAELEITRLAMYGWKGGWVMPLERSMTWSAKY